MNETLNRGTGLLLIEVINSNPNGDPDRESDPRTRFDHRGEISPVSFKRKVRDLVVDKQSIFWKELSGELGLEDERFDILERQDTNRSEVGKLDEDQFLRMYWDARVFGSTFLEEKGQANSFIKTGVAQFGLGVSLSPIHIERMTTTKVMPVEEDKSKGMAPLAYRIVSYGVYAMPFFVNATAAARTQCTRQDIELLLRLIPFAYTQSASYIRPQVNIRHAFYVEHHKARGTFNDFKIIEALTPKSHLAPHEEASSWKDYDEEGLWESIRTLNAQLTGKADSVVDLTEQL